MKNIKLEDIKDTDKLQIGMKLYSVNSKGIYKIINVGEQSIRIKNESGYEHNIHRSYISNYYKLVKLSSDNEGTSSQSRELTDDDIKVGTKLREKVSGLIASIIEISDNGIVVIIDENATKIRVNKYYVINNYERYIDNHNSEPVPTTGREEEEEEEEEEDEDDYILDDLTAEELSTIKIEEFFNKDEIGFLISKEQIIEYRNNLIKQENKDVNPLKKKIYDRRISSTYIDESYFDFIEKKIPQMTAYKFTAKIPYRELWDIRNKDRVIFPKNLNNVTGFSSGVIFYWVFYDGIVFKTA